ncbi:MAG: gliding motility-associated C-terminal domain-containing protein [Bacteroidia bacterium]|nr:gliding motility-associated C-terminal domain-containing protein [Bacteroidia bacterium]
MKYLASILIISLSLFFLGSTNYLPHRPGDEICDNAIDDDNDGLIDLNDEDCDCSLVEPLSLIPNPSFEEKDCCPETIGEMNCAVSWVQASPATADYFHSCSRNFVNIPVPQPLPGGEGFVGILNGEPAKRSNYKEYIGACLLDSLEKGKTYRLEFYASFPLNSSPAPINFTLFGTANCDNLPFGQGIALVGCPTNTPGWTELGKVYSSVFNGWKKLSLNFTPTEDIFGIAIGPPCPTVDRRTDTKAHYYFLDELTLAEEFSFDFKIQTNNQPCSKDFFLEVPNYPQLDYQWYKNGIALIGENQAYLSAPIEAGVYQLSVTNGSMCRVTQPFDYIPPPIHTYLEESICEGESFLFNRQSLGTPGTYFDTLKTEGGCDSLISLALEVLEIPEVEIEAKIFPQEIYRLGDFSFSTAGDYTRVLTSRMGCDSIVHLSLTYYSVYVPTAFSPNGDGINDYFTLYGEEELELIESLTVFNRWGNRMFSKHNLAPNAPEEGWGGKNQGKALTEGVYIYRAEILMEGGQKKSLSGSITLFR